MFRKLRIGKSEMCPCGTAPKNAEHVLQACPLYHSNRSALWPQETTLNDKLYGGLEQLTTTAQFEKKYRTPCLNPPTKKKETFEDRRSKSKVVIIHKALNSNLEIEPNKKPVAALR